MKLDRVECELLSRKKREAELIRIKEYVSAHACAAHLKQTTERPMSNDRRAAIGSAVPLPLHLLAEA